MNQEKSEDNPSLVVADCVEIFPRDGIIHVAYNDGAEIGIEAQRELHLAFLRITNGIKHPFLFYTRGSFWMSKDAREYERKIESQQPFLAVACVAQDLGTRLLADFYGKFYKPEIPYKVFSSETEALKWLQSFR